MISGVSASISLAFTQISGTPNTIYGGGVVGPAHQDNRLRPGILLNSFFNGIKRQIDSRSGKLNHS